MKCLFSILLIFPIFNSCGPRNVNFADIGNQYYSEYSCIKQGAEIYRSSKTDKKLNGNIVRRNTGMYDSTLNFKLVSTFHKGLLDGPDSLFRDGKLLSVKHYSRGIQQGEQIAFEDSMKVVSRYVDGVIDGAQLTFMGDRLIKKAYFHQGIKDSLEHYFDSLGVLATSIEYSFYQNSSWFENLHLEENQLISFSNFETFDPKYLKTAHYKGTISFHSHDPKGIADPSVWEVVHESILNDDYCDQTSPYFEYFYIIHENTCSVCDYIDLNGIWIAYVGMHGSNGANGLATIEYFFLK